MWRGSFCQQLRRKQHLRELFQESTAPNINTLRHNKRRHLKFLAVYKQHLNFITTFNLWFLLRHQHVWAKSYFHQFSCKQTELCDVCNVCLLIITWMWLTCFLVLELLSAFVKRSNIVFLRLRLRGNTVGTFHDKDLQSNLRGWERRKM